MTDSAAEAASASASREELRISFAKWGELTAAPRRAEELLLATAAWERALHCSKQWR